VGDRDGHQGLDLLDRQRLALPWGGGPGEQDVGGGFVVVDAEGEHCHAATPVHVT
jgi:hypothetical protein